MRLNRTLWWCAGCLVVGAVEIAACASGPGVYHSSSGDGGDGGDASGSIASNGSGATSSGAGGGSTQSSGPGGAGAGGAGAGGSAPDLKICRHTCAAPADCAAGTPVTDADNYSCKGGVCEYLGCNSTAECVQTYNSPNYACGLDPSSPVPGCYHTCSVSADCVLGIGLYDADNYKCNGGLCQWLGCKSTDECVQAFNNPSYACGPTPGLSYDNCYITCSSPVDCETGTSLSDADNYECNGGRCDWLGCNSTNECTQTFMDQSYICQ